MDLSAQVPKIKKSVTKKQSETTKQNETRKKRCAKGTKYNKKTGKCEPIPIKLADLPTIKLPVPAKAEDEGEEAGKDEGEEEEEGEEAMEGEEGEEEADKSGPEENDYEETENKYLSDNPDDYDFLYPSLNDPNFNIKLTQKKEFFDTQYDGEIHADIEAHANKLCNADYDMAPHQLFVRNFLSFQTPYNSLLLYHGLGSGKTCSAIGVAEEMRDYIMNMGMISQIIIVASPNVQANFRIQLFDESKLTEIDGLWNIRACTGNKFLKEINPMNMQGLSRENVIKQVNRVIDIYYYFFGYVSFANYIINKGKLDDASITDKNKIRKIKQNKLRKVFENRLIIIDEVQNIRISEDNKDKRVAEALLELISYVDTLRLLLLSATPMYNSYKEIIWLINLMNKNDRRPPIKTKDVFDAAGNFKEGGKELLERKATGYISFVRGENPYTFPYRIWPTEFASNFTFPVKSYPTIQMLGKGKLIQSINPDRLSLYLVDIGETQQLGYDYIISRLAAKYSKNLPDLENENELNEDEANDEDRGKKAKEGEKEGEKENEKGKFGYTVLQQPLQALNIIYPDARLAAGNTGLDPRELVGGEGLRRMMNYVTNENTKTRNKFEYKPETLAKYGKIFALEEIGKYSSKIKKICELIAKATGVILVYSQYIDGGLVPIALALEEMGYARAGGVNSLFATPPTKRNGFKYVMITGEKGFTPDPVADIKLATRDDNKDGGRVKVILISQTGAEGLDLKFIRQVHILEPWYNLNRIEQIIGRAVRTCSHKALPFLKRNVEIYLYASLNQASDEETTDLYVYRLAEKKAGKIGMVTRVLKESSIDCILNYGQNNFTAENMADPKYGITPITLELASEDETAPGKQMLLENYKIGDRPFSAICDYMDTCAYQCKPAKKIEDIEVQMDTYNEDFIMMNTEKIIYKIKELFKNTKNGRFFIKKAELREILVQYPPVQINAALQILIEDKNEYVTDKYGRLGHLINIDDLYIFQPMELKNTRSSIYERANPIEIKHNKILIKLAKDDKVVEPVQQEQGRAEPAAAAAAAAQPVGVDVGTKTIEKLAEEIKLKYKHATTTQNIGTGEKEWYKFGKIAIDLMKDKNINGEVIDEEYLQKLVIEHIVDELSLNDIKLLLNQMDRNPLFDKPLFAHVKRYLKTQIMKGEKRIKGILWKNAKENILIVQSPNAAAAAAADAGLGGEWHNAEAEDKKDLEKEVTKKKNKLTNFNDIIGFMNNFKTEEYVVFKTKNIKKNESGARCDQKGSKGNSTILLNLIVGGDEYTTKLKIHQQSICILQEFYLRIYQKQAKDGKCWFLTPAEAVLKNIEGKKNL